jgi:glutamate-1-semialdehyde 2,1-aminomutase
MLDRGVALAPGPYEIAFTSMAHSQEDLERTVEVAGEAMADVVAN